MFDEVVTQGATYAAILHLDHLVLHIEHLFGFDQHGIDVDLGHVVHDHRHP